jgi:hypothetical protein
MRIRAFDSRRSRALSVRDRRRAAGVIAAIAALGIIASFLSLPVRAGAPAPIPDARAAPAGGALVNAATSPSIAAAPLPAARSDPSVAIPSSSPQPAGPAPLPNARTIAGPTSAPTPTSTPISPPPNPVSGETWQPGVALSWQWQLATPVDTSVAAQVYDIDGFDNPASVVGALHAQGRKVICYISAGTYENWRPDAAQFPAATLGSRNGWPGENWLDVRALAIRPIMAARLDMCKAKGFDAVEPDNIDGYTNGTGFPLTATDQSVYNTWIADQAHRRGLAVFLKNDGDQVAQLLPHFDGAIEEQCAEYRECDLYAPFVGAGKPVFGAEYQGGASARCATLNAANFNGIYKKLALDAYRVACR